MAGRATIAVSVLGAALDKNPEHSDFTTGTGGKKWIGLGAGLLAIDTLVINDDAVVRLYRWNPELERWVPSSVPSFTLTTATDAGVKELRYNTARIEGPYILAQESGTGIVTHSYRYFREA